MIPRPVMQKVRAVEIAHAHAAECGVPWRRVVRVAGPPWWLPWLRNYEIEVDTGRGPFRADVSAFWGCVIRCRFEPTDPGDFHIPPWLAGPPWVGMVSMYWKEGGGEVEINRWAEWFHRLPPERQQEYIRRFPVTGRDGWTWFWDLPGRPPAESPTESEKTP